MGPEELEGIKKASRRKLLHFEGRPELAELARQLVKEVLPHVGLQGEPIGVVRDDGSEAGFSVIVTLPGAERQPFHLDSNVGQVHSILVPLNQRRFNVVSRQEPIVLDAGDALVFKADELCHGGDGLGLGEAMRCALFVYVGRGVTEEVVTQSFECEWRSPTQWAQALTMEGLGAALQKPKIDTMGAVVTELHGRLLTGDAAQRPKLEAGAAETVLRNLTRVAERAASPQALAAVEAGRWPSEASIMLQSARLAVAVAKQHPRPPAGWANATESAYANTHAWAGVKRTPSARRGAANRECAAVTAG